MQPDEGYDSYIFPLANQQPSNIDLTNDDDEEPESGTPPPRAQAASVSTHTTTSTSTSAAGPSILATAPRLPLPASLSSSVQQQQHHQYSSYRGPAAPFQPPRASAIPGHPSAVAHYASPGVAYGGRSAGKQPSFANTAQGQLFSNQAAASSSRLPPQPRQPVNPITTSGGQGQSLFLRQPVKQTVAKTYVSREQFEHNQRQQPHAKQTAWSGSAVFGDQSNAYSYQPPASQPRQAYLPPPTQQHPNPYPDDPTFPSSLPLRPQQQQQQPQPSTSSTSLRRESSSIVIDVVSPEPERAPSPPPAPSSGPLPPGFHRSQPVIHDTLSQSPELSADMAPYARKAMPFAPGDPETYDSRGKRDTIKRGTGGAGWASSTFNDDDGPTASGSGSRGGGGNRRGGGGGGGYQAAAPPTVPSRRSSGVAGASGGGAGAGGRLLQGAMAASISVKNNGSRGKQKNGKGKGKERGEEQDDDDLRIEGGPKSQAELMKEMRSFRRNSNDHQISYSPSTSHASLPTPVQSSSFHSVPQASTSRHVVQQHDPPTAEEREGRAAMERERAKNAKGKGKAISVKGAATKKKPEVLELDDSSEEEAQDDDDPFSTNGRNGGQGRGRGGGREEDDDDPIQDDDDELDGRLNGGRPAAGKKKHRLSFSFNAILDEPQDQQSSPDPLGMGISSGHVAAQRKVWNERASGNGGGGGAGQGKKMVASMQGRKRPCDGASLTNQDDPPPSNPSTMAPPSTKGRVPRAAQEAVKKGAQSAPVDIGNGMFSIEIRAPMFGRQGIPLDSRHYRYNLVAAMRGGKNQQKITITRRRGGKDTEEVVEFKLKDVKTIDYAFAAQNPNSARTKEPFYGFRLNNDWNWDAWQGLCNDCGLPSTPEEKYIHVVYTEPIDKTSAGGASSPEQLFHEVLKACGKPVIESSSGIAAGLLSNYYNILQQNNATYDRIQARAAQSGRPSNGSSAKSKGDMKQMSLTFELHSTRGHLGLQVDQDNDLIHPSSAVRSSSRPSTSHLAAPHNQEKAIRQRRDSERRQSTNYLDTPDINLDGEVQVQEKPQPEPYAADEIVLEYPLERIPGQASVSLNYGDTKRLRDDEFLNDTLIEFGLKRAIDAAKEADKTRPEEEQIAPKVHIFNSFFYKQLSSGKGPKKYENGYALVEKWTKKFNLFDKKYIVVPINEHLHWYLAVIVNPAAILRPPNPAKSSQPTRKSGRTSKPSARASEVDGSAETVSLPSSSHPGSPAEVTTSRFFKQKGEQPEEQQPERGDGDVEMDDAEDQAEENRKSRETEEQFRAVVAAKEGPAALQDEGGDQEMLAHSDDDLEVTGARPGVEGGGPKRAADGTAPSSSALDSVAVYGSDDDEPSTLEEVADSQEHEKPPPSAQALKQVAVAADRDNLDPITLEDSDDEAQKSSAAPAMRAKKLVKGKEKAKKDKNVDVVMADKADDRASDTTPDGEDSDKAVENTLLPPTSGQPSAKASRPSSAPLVKKVVPPAQQTKPASTTGRQAVLIVPSLPPGGETPQRSPPVQQEPVDQAKSAAEEDLAKVLAAVDIAAADAEKANECYILVFDSLESVHEAAVKTLRQYLALEAKKKLQKTVDEIAPDEVIGINVKLPKQPNFCDCGLYLLHFVEKFLANPDYVLSIAIALDKPKPRHNNAKAARTATLAKLWDDDVAQKKRAKMRGEVGQLMDQYLKEVRPKLQEAQAKAEKERQEERRKRKEERARQEQEGEDPAVQEAIAASVADQKKQSASASTSAAAAAAAPTEEEEAQLPKAKGRGGKRKKTPPPPETLDLLSDDESTASPSPKKPKPLPLHPHTPRPASPELAGEAPSVSRQDSLAHLVHSTEKAPSSPVFAEDPSVTHEQERQEQAPSTSQATVGSSRRAQYGPSSPDKSQDGEGSNDFIQETFAPHPGQAAGIADLPLPLSPTRGRLPSPHLINRSRPRCSSPAGPSTSTPRQQQDDEPPSKKARKTSPSKSSSASSLAEVGTAASTTPMPFTMPVDIPPNGKASLAGKGKKPEKGKKVVAPAPLPQQPAPMQGPSGFAASSDDEAEKAQTHALQVEREGAREGDINSDDDEEPDEAVLVSPAKPSFAHSHPRHRAPRSPTPLKSHSKPSSSSSSSKRRARAQTPINMSSSAPSTTLEECEYEPSSPPSKRHKGKGKGKDKATVIESTLASGDQTEQTFTGATHTRFSSGDPPEHPNKKFERIKATLQTTADEEDDNEEVAVKSSLEPPTSNQQAVSSSSTTRTTRASKKAEVESITID